MKDLLFIQEIVNRTLQIALNKPKQANSFTLNMYTDFKQIIEGAAKDDNVVLIKANGRNFPSGNDLTFSHNSEATELLQYAKETDNLLKLFTKAFLNP